MNNLPDGITESMIHGCRPEDEEIEIIIVFNRWEIEKWKEFNERQLLLPESEKHYLSDVVCNLVEQFDE